MAAGRKAHAVELVSVIINPLVKAVLIFAGSIGSLAVANVLLKVGMDRLAAFSDTNPLHWRQALTVWELPVGVLFMTMHFVGMLPLF